jgi:hypothetical protein
MKAHGRNRPAEDGSRWDPWVPPAMGALALLPLATYHGMFGRLFWFGDEFDLIDQMDRLGIWRWAWLAFAENFVPLFKLLWGGAVLASGGSCFTLIAILWLTHAFNVALLGRLMRSCGLPWAAVLLAQAVFGLTSVNFETLAWSVQWSQVLSVMFMLLALERFARGPGSLAPVGWAAASALSFSRGVLTGILLALASAWPGGWGPPTRARTRAALAGAYLLPSVVTAILIALLTPTANERHMAGHWADASVFGAWCYCLNPAYRLLGIASWGLGTVLLLGTLKVALVACSLACSRGRARTLFVVLTLSDLANAVLLGIGRFHTGLPAAVSSRYQYASLVAVLPLAGFWLSRLCERIPGPAAARRVILAALLAGACVLMCRQWRVEIDPFTVWRGTDSRRVLLNGSGPVPGSPGISMERAHELVSKYHLH